jgi:hypothetical protein
VTGNSVRRQFDEVIGYFSVGGLFRGSTVYVTMDRIMVNKGRGQLNLKVHALVSLLLLFIPVLPSSGQLAVLLAIAAYITVVIARKRRSPRRKWPTLGEVERGHRRFEIKKDHVLTIELKRPRRLHYGQFMITSISGESFSSKIIADSIFRVASSLMARFAADRVRIAN